jgi:hypothetical protein
MEAKKNIKRNLFFDFQKTFFSKETYAKKRIFVFRDFKDVLKKFLKKRKIFLIMLFRELF